MQNFRQQAVKVPLAYKEHHDSDIRILLLQLLVQVVERFKREVEPFVFVFESS